MSIRAIDFAGAIALLIKTNKEIPNIKYEDK